MQKGDTLVGEGSVRNEQKVINMQRDKSEISSDNRGGEKGQSRKYTPETKRPLC